MTRFFESDFFRKVLLVLFLIIALFSSFDIFLKLHLAGFSLRFAQVLIFALVGVFPFYFFSVGKVKMSGALVFLFVWLLIQLLFVQNTIYLVRGVFYWIWALSFFVLLWYIENVGFEVSDLEFKWFVKAYGLSFVLIALFGLFQSLVPLLGLASRGPFQTQSWIKLLFVGINLPRINGFNYEPSYFVAYLLPAVPLLFYFTLHDTYRKFWGFLWVLVSFTIVFSTARTGIFMLILTLGILALYWLLSRFSFSKYRIFYLAVLFGGIGIFALLVIMPITRSIVLSPLNYVFRDSSFSTRVEEQREVIGLFLQHPLNGFSLGGIAPARASLHHILVNGNAATKSYEGMNVFFEILLSGGLFGFLFFMLFQARLFGDSLKLYRKALDQKTRDLIFLVSLGTLVQFVTLFFNQNILRIYFWMTLAVLVFVQQVVRRKVLDLA